MTTRRPARVMAALLHEVLQASSMLLFLLSGIATSRRRQYVQPGVARPLDLPGLPDLCISPSIVNVPDDDLYGAGGAAAQMAYKGWIAELYGLWEHRYRPELQASLGEDAIPPEMDALGDLREIRNDLLHSGTASAARCQKCSTLKWFKPGERMVFDTTHVLDFLNHRCLGLALRSRRQRVMLARNIPRPQRTPGVVPTTKARIGANTQRRQGGRPHVQGRNGRFWQRGVRQCAAPAR